MSERLERIQSGKARGVVAHVARAGLWVMGAVWGGVQALKQIAYRVGLRRARQLDRPVISVGNLVAGGTGKTPFVIALAQALCERGRHPGILARGYRREPGALLNDEGLEIQQVFGDAVPQVQDPDRVRGGRRLLAAHPDVDVLLLDDGFQHRRVHRDLDIVLIDAAQPFGFGHYLPRGRLRESPRALARAGLVVLTRCEQVDDDTLRDVTAKIEAHTPAPVFRTSTSASRVRCVDRTQPPEALRGARVHLAAGVGRPAAVRATVEGLGATVLRSTAFSDHATPGAERWRQLVADAKADDGVLVVTRKDAVKLPALLPGMAVLEIELRLDEGLVDAVVAVIG